MADLFSGCGGFSLGIVEACRSRRIFAEIVLAVDADNDTLQVYRKNFGLACSRADCTTIEKLFQGRLGAPLSDQERELRNAVGRVDLLVAGPPCQGHSDLNNHSRRLDRRNALYARVARAAEVLKPQVVIIENVVGVVNDRGRVVSRVRKLLASKGFAVEPICIDARQIGVPQRRRRHFLVGFNEHIHGRWVMPGKYRGAHWTVGDVLKGLEDEPSTSTGIFQTPSRCTKLNARRIAHLFKTDSYDLPDSRRPRCHKDNDHTYKAVYGRLRWDGVANTITGGFGSMGQGRYVHPKRPRLITPHEAARLQGFPDWFSFGGVSSRGSLQRMIGNAVVPRVAAWLVRHLLVTQILNPVPKRARRAERRGGLD